MNISFVTGFAFIGIMWMNHHRLFTHIERCDDLLLVLNLLLLFRCHGCSLPNLRAGNLPRPTRSANSRTAVQWNLFFDRYFLQCALAIWRFRTAPSSCGRYRHDLSQ
jgi:hypothetical protein